MLNIFGFNYEEFWNLNGQVFIANKKGQLSSHACCLFGPINGLWVLRYKKDIWRTHIGDLWIVSWNYIRLWRFVIVI